MLNEVSDAVRDVVMRSRICPACALALIADSLIDLKQLDVVPHIHGADNDDGDGDGRNGADHTGPPV
jgi:hypothetical protein